MYVAKFQISHRDLNDALDAAPHFGVQVEEVYGEPNTIEVRGDYDAVHTFLMDYTTEADADTMIQDERDVDRPEDHFADAHRKFHREGVTLKSLIEHAADGDPVADDLCPVCGRSHDDPTNTCDYEECGECGFDHMYEPDAARDWHEEHDRRVPVYDEPDEWLGAGGRMVREAEGDIDYTIYAVGCSSCDAPGPEGVDAAEAALAQGWIDVGHPGYPAWQCPECQKKSHNELESPEDYLSARTDPSGRAFESVQRDDQALNFDKFIDRIVKQEASSPKMKSANDSLQRVRAAKHQERPLGRIVYRRK